MPPGYTLTTGDSGNNVLVGGAGTDTLNGGTGLDVGCDFDNDTTKVSVEKICEEIPTFQPKP